MAAFRRPFNQLHFRIAHNHCCGRVAEHQFGCGLFRNLHNNGPEIGQESKILSWKNIGESTSDLTFAERCKNILAVNWQGLLTTVKADATGSKGQLHSSLIQYTSRNGKPVMWLQEDDLHTVNTVLDERGSLSVGHTDPPPLVKSLKTIQKFPPSAVLVGDVIPLQKEKVHSAMKELNDMIVSEREMVDQASYQVTSILKCSGPAFDARINSLKLMLDRIATSAIYEFSMRTCSYFDIFGEEHKVDLKDIETAAMDPLSPFFGALIEGINQSQTRRTGLKLFCSAFLKVNPKDAFMLSIDRKGFDVLGKVSNALKNDAKSNHFLWKEYRFSFGSEVGDIETFCCLLVKMEEEALKHRSFFIL